jgi:anaerobic magnesium-protoporphyrin IX monomethyl ester cyclase
VVAGNSVATSIPELLLRHTDVDIAVMGEADQTIVELLGVLDKKESLAAVRGIAYRENGTILHTPSRPVIADITAIGFPAWDLFDLGTYDHFAAYNANIFSSGRTMPYPINSARGCPFNCTFCYHVFKGQKYRKCQNAAIMAEMARLHDSFHADFVTFWDELTFATIKSVEQFLEGLARLDFAIAWDAPIRANLFTKEHVGLVRAMKAAGCDNMAFSLENADEKILAAINKKIDLAQFVEQSLTLWEGGVPPRTSVIFGYPQETPQSIQKTIDVCDRCNIFPSVGFLLPLPMTPIYAWARENGYIDDEVAYLERIGDRQDLHLNLTAMSDRQLVDTVESKLRALAEKQGLKLDSVLKTTTYRKPEVLNTAPQPGTAS